MSNAQLSSDCIELAMKEVVEQEDFLKFHENLATGNVVGNSECHCSRTPTVRKNLAKCKM